LINKEEKAKEFDNYFVDNYKKIKASATSLLKHRSDVEDVMHNVYLTIRDRIERKGYSGDTYGGYIYVSLQNEFKLAKNREKRHREIDISEEHIEYVADWCLQDLQLSEQKDKDLQYKNEFIIQILFEFIEGNFNEKEFYLFRVYYLSENKMTYEKLAKQTGYQFSSLAQIIKNMKKRIRNEFQPYLHKRYIETFRKS